MFPDVPILGCSATAAEHTLGDVVKRLNMKKCYLFRSSMHRENLFYQVKHVAKDADKTNDIINFVKTHYPNETGIIYSGRVAGTESIAKNLKVCGFF